MGRHVESGAALPQLQCARGDGVSVRRGEAAELDVRNPSGRRGEATELDVRRPSGTNPLRFFFLGLTPVYICIASTRP